MAEKGFFSWLFGNREESDSVEESRNETTLNGGVADSTNVTLQDAITFIAELQSYYYNDICKMQADLLVKTDLPIWHVNFINKKIKQEQVALNQIDSILEQLQQKERDFQSIFGKSVYTFYDEIEKQKLTTVQREFFNIMLKLCEVNTKPELDDVIRNRLDVYRNAWNITTKVNFPENYNAVLINAENGIEHYRFGTFFKQVKPSEQEITLTPKQLDKIRALKFEFDEQIQTDVVWVKVSSVARYQLNFMRRTCTIESDWEYSAERNVKLSFDVVALDKLEQYLKGVLQIVLARRIHTVISIFVPTNDMLRIIGPVEKKEQKVEIAKKYLFYLRERSALYQKNLLTARIDRRHIPEKVNLVSYLNFKNDNF